MEEGSLLEEALRHGKDKKRNKDDEFDDLNNTLIIDVFPLSNNHDNRKNMTNHTISQLLYLAELAQICNEVYQTTSNGYRWHYGGDGPIFGIHFSDDDETGREKEKINQTKKGGKREKLTTIPHLRAYCHYGPNVSDEWTAIDYVFQMSRTLHQRGIYVAISCWDADDGQVMLIQVADILPEWLDEDSTDKHRYACWIVPAGKIHLFQTPKHISLSTALRELQKLEYDNDGFPATSSSKDRASSSTSNSSTSTSCSIASTERIQVSLMKWLELNRKQRQVQTTPLVVPRKIAILIDRRPDLVHAAIQEFCENIHDNNDDENNAHGKENSSLSNSSSNSSINYEDWVWTTHSLSRTNYAMVRTMISSPPSSKWKTAEYIPKKFLRNVEVKRYQRQCAVEATPHLKYALQIGIRLVTGFEYLIRKGQDTRFNPLSMEKRIGLWCQLNDHILVGTGTKQQESEQSSSEWILDAYQQGPNHSKYNIEHLLKCPVFPQERFFPTLYSYPETSIRQQVLQAQKGTSNKNKNGTDQGDEDDRFMMPLASDVDTNEDWMVITGQENNNDTNNNEIRNRDLDDIMSKFQNFMVQSSGLQGIVTTNNSNDTTIGTKNTTVEDTQRRPNNDGNTTNNNHNNEMIIRPRIFLNILHTILKDDDTENIMDIVSFPNTDPYFFEEDYTYMEEIDNDDEDDGDVDETMTGTRQHTVEKIDNEMKDMMDVMDEELKGKSYQSRNLDSILMGEDDDEEEYDDEEGAENGSSTRNNNNGTLEVPEKEVAENAHFLNNMLRSLEAEGGRSGPGSNMIQEMGGTIPR